MNRVIPLLVALFTLQFHTGLSAQSLLDQFDFVGDQAEALEPGLFPSSQITMTAQEMGYDWFFRFYPATQTYLALNTDLLDIYTYGGPWPEPTRIDSLQNILNMLGYVPPGDGGDGGSGGDDGGSGGDDGGSGGDDGGSGGDDGGSGGDDGGSGGDGATGNRILNAGNSSCLNLTLPAVNTVTVHTSNFTDPELGEVEVTITTTYTDVSNTAITTRVEQPITQGGITGNTISITTSYSEQTNGWLFSTREDSETSTSFFGQTTTGTTSLTYEPSKFVSPLTVCNGMSWYTASVTSRQISTANGVSLPEFSGPTGDGTVEVISVDYPMSVPAGQFSTVYQVMTNLDSSGDSLERTEAYYLNSAGSIPVRIDFYDESGTLSATMVLQSITVN